jgi:protein-tyrosine-phosphatase
LTGKRPDERIVVFVSAGGTCRDPMAKAISEVLLRDHQPGFTVRLEAAALEAPRRDAASRAARRAIVDMFGEDLLATHKPAMLSPDLIEDADLILVMEEGMLNGLPLEKTHLLKRFFGSDGEIADPYPDGDDPETTRRYAQCAEELRAVIEPQLPRLIRFLEPR